MREKWLATGDGRPRGAAAMKMECPGCAVEITPRDGVCPICGYEFPRRRPLIVGVGFLVLAAFIGAILVQLVRALR